MVFFDFKLKSGEAGVLEQFPHVVASVSNLGDERHLVGRMLRRWKASLIVAARCATPSARTWWI